MAAGLGFKTFTTGEVLTAADTNGYLMQGINVFASTAARDAAITSPQEGQFAFTKDTNGLWYYDGAAWVASGATGDIEGVTAGVGITGGGTSGTVTVTNDMATTITASGDIVVGTGSGTYDNLPIGTTNQVLTADTTVSPYKVKWATVAAGGGTDYAAGKNGVLNSNFSVWQRGTSTTLTSTSFVSDRWQAIRAVAGATATRQVTGDTTNLPFIQYCLRVARDSGNTSTSVISMGQNFESFNSIPFAGKTVTMSFYARAGANYSQASSALNVYLTSGTGTDQNNITSSFTGATQVVNSTATLTTTWQRFTYTGTVAATATQLSPQFQFTPVGTAGANDYYEITGVQVEIAASATAFSPNCPTYATELAACQRYFEKWFTVQTGFGASASGGNICAKIFFKQTMRTSPTITHNLTNANYLTNWELDVAFVGSAVTKTGTVGISNYADNIGVIFALTSATWSATPNVFIIIANLGSIEASAEL